MPSTGGIWMSINITPGLSSARTVSWNCFMELIRHHFTGTRDGTIKNRFVIWDVFTDPALSG